MVAGAKVCELTDGFLWFVCGNFDVSPKPIKVYFRLLKYRMAWEQTVGEHRI